MDGLMTVTPFGDDNLKLLRPNLLLNSPSFSNVNSLINLNDIFGIHQWRCTNAKFGEFGRFKRLASNNRF